MLQNPKPPLFYVLPLLLSGLLYANPVITEIVASNGDSLADEDGAYSDWIEIHNPTASPIDMTGWRLTDSATNLAKWTFPAMTLAPGEFRIVFASSKNRVKRQNL